MGLAAAKINSLHASMGLPAVALIHAHACCRGVGPDRALVAVVPTLTRAAVIIMVYAAVRCRLRLCYIIV